MFAMKKFILTAFAIAAVVATSGQANAAFAIRIIHSSGTTTINDGDFIPLPFIDVDGSIIGIQAAKFTAPSTINTSFTIGSFTISGFSGNIGGSGLTVSSAALGVNISSTAAGSITFEISRTGYTFPVGGLRKVTDSFSTTTGVTPVPGRNVSYQSWINSDNSLFSTTGPSIGPIGLSPIPTGSQSTNSSGTLASAGTFSITTRTTFTFAGAAGDVGYNSRTDVTPPANIVPAPAGLLLSLLGLPALAFARRFRRAVPVQA